MEELASYSVQNLALSKERWLAQDYKSVVDWNQPSSLEPNSYLTAIQYDALGRIKAQTAPDGRIIIPAYNERGLLLSEEVDDGGNLTDYLKEMRYDARGQRSHAEYHNGVYTRYTYDTETFRLTRLLTRAGASILQDLNYTYDPVGNITLKKDDNIPDIFYANQQVHPAQSYTYDALYRLTEATGREHMGGASFGPEDNWDDAPFLHQHHQNDNMPMQNYTQYYAYDEAGNITELRHQAAAGSYTRDYQYSSTNNQLQSSYGGMYTYTHDPDQGYITSMPHLPLMDWNYKDELVAVSRQQGANPEITYYQYDSQGRRLRKVTEYQGSGPPPGQKDQRIYLEGYEYYENFNSGEQIHSLSLKD